MSNGEPSCWKQQEFQPLHMLPQGLLSRPSSYQPHRKRSCTSSSPQYSARHKLSEGSQGQNKTYLIALKLAQFDFLRRTGSHTTPLLLLDDIFDKLDASRVEQIVKLVAGDKFGQIFITDTNRDHLDKIMQKIEGEYKVFSVEDGAIHERKGEEA